MAKFLIGLVTGVILTILLAVIVIFSAAKFGTEKRAVILPNSTLLLQLEGEIPERSPVEFPFPFLDQQTPSTVKDVWEILRKAAVDSRIKAVVLEPRGVDVGWAKLEELRADLEQFRKSGKPLIAYLKQPGTREYYLATAADRIYMGPEEVLDVKGLRAEIMFFRGTLDKLGVQMEVEHAGKYKDYGDTFTRTEMGPETREVLNSILDDVYGRLISTIGIARKKPPEDVRSDLDEGPFLAKQALAKGLVDSLMYEDQMFGELESRLKSGELKKVNHREYAKVTPASLDMEGKPKLAFLVGQGAITRGDPTDDGIGEDGITSEGFNKLLRRIGNDGDIRGVIVRIDSPGGDSAASDDIWREMNALSKKKPLVVSMSDAAASGGYYMAMTGDPIVAYPGTYTGSIGVVMLKPTLHGLYDKLGITIDGLSRGRFANLDSTYHPLSPAERQKLRERIDDTYRAFVTKVADARKRQFTEIDALAQGRVWLGSQAKPKGLVDELGGIDRAIEMVKDKAKIGRQEKVTIVSYPARRTIFDLAFGRNPDSAFESKFPGLGKILNNPQIRALMQGGLLRLMPYAIEIR